MLLIKRSNGKPNNQHEIDRLLGLCEKYDRLAKSANSVAKHRTFTNKSKKYRIKWEALREG